MQIRFQKEKDDFLETIQRKVNAYFATNGISKKANGFFYLKAAILIGAYLTCFALLLFSDQTAVAFWSMVLLGPLAILIGINVGHDAAHGTISDRSWVNRTFLLCFDLLGANSYIWRNRHVYSHHSYPNVLNQDADLKQSTVIRIFPNDKQLKIHRLQFLYAPLLYLLYTINWLHLRDYGDFFRDRIGSFKVFRHPTREVVKLIGFKLLYLTYIVIIPLLFSVLSWQLWLLAFLVMNFAASLLMTLALIPSHVAENSEFPLPNENGELPLSWSHHQVTTVTDFATGNVFLNFFFGGFNHHITHHLIPDVNHVHAVHITPIIKKTIEEYGMTYNYEDSFLNAYLSHFRLLRNNGLPQLIGE